MLLNLFRVAFEIHVSNLFRVAFNVTRRAGLTGTADRIEAAWQGYDYLIHRVVSRLDPTHPLDRFERAVCEAAYPNLIKMYSRGVLSDKELARLFREKQQDAINRQQYAAYVAANSAPQSVPFDF
jgi:hypothetical protein